VFDAPQVSLEDKKAQIRKKREEMNKKYSVNFSTEKFKFNRDDANDYE
jgi:hypothetical protein